MTPALAVDTQDQSAPQPGAPTNIGRFIIREEIGRGSNGVVYSATDPVLGRDIAIKAIPLDPRNPARRQIEASFLQEAKMAAGLNHASIVTVFDAGKTDTVAYIAMERLTGADLHHWQLANGTMSAEGAAALIARVCDAVHFAHRRGLIHRDIKPSNIFLSRDLKPKVLDFGIALAQGKQGGPDDPPKLIGTPNYMSPEQALGRPLDARSDIFSIGAILYELVTGHRAFEGANVDEILTKVVKVDPAPLSSWQADLPPQIGEIIFRALAKNPANRYQTAAQLRNDLASFAGRPVLPSTAPSFDAMASPRGRLRLPAPGALLALGAAVLALVLSFAYWYWGPHARDIALSNPPPQAPSPTPAAPPVVTLPAAGSSGSGASSPHVAVAAPKPTKPRKKATPPPPPPVVAAAPPPPEPGSLALAIVPWGTVLVDGKEVGVAPPLNKLTLAPGAHFIEVRNGALAPFAAQVQIESGKTIAVQHHF